MAEIDVVLWIGDVIETSGIGGVSIEEGAVVPGADEVQAMAAVGFV